ncbi:Site-specific recombinase [Streptomyces hygroscopicus]|nr:Site-specific recombinase [Streptomyces hygroscopicus]
MRLHAHSDDVTLTVTLPADYLPEIADAAERINDTMPAHAQKPMTRNRATGTRVDAVCAPAGHRQMGMAAGGWSLGPRLTVESTLHL